MYQIKHQKTSYHYLGENKLKNRKIIGWRHLAQHYTTESPLRVFEAFAGIGTQRMALNNLILVTE